MKAEALKVEKAGDLSAAESLKKSEDAAAGAGNNEKAASITPTGAHLTRDEAWTAQGSFMPGE